MPRILTRTYPPASALLAGLALLALAVSCAVPQAPTGGDPVQTPPEVASIEPETGTVNFEGQSVEIIFENYVDRGSVDQALSVTPTQERAPEVIVRGRRVVISFLEPLQENTTYIVTLDTDLQTARNVSLEEPLTIAFATGSTIDRGRIAGSVEDIYYDEPADGYDVYAYPAPDSVPPDSLPERPAYRTQTNDQGEFTFDYLREQPYFVIALQDRNRNRQPDPDEPFAVPPEPVLYAHPDEEAVDTLLAEEEEPAEELPQSNSPPETEAEDEDLAPWLVARLDTLSPEIQRARARSPQHLQVRFTEPVRLTSPGPEGWVLTSEEDETVEIQEVFMRPDSDREVHVFTPPLDPGTYRIRPANVVDFEDNPLGDAEDTFEATEDGQPPALEFMGFEPAVEDADTTFLLPDERPAVAFNQPLTDSRLREVVSVQDTTGEERSFSPQTEDGTTYELDLDPAMASGEEIDVVVDERNFAEVDTLTTRRYQRIAERELGGLGGVASAEDTTASIVVEVFRDEADTEDGPFETTTADSDGSFLFESLPEGSYRLRLFVDENENDRWDGGTLIPHQLPEPIRWIETAEEVRPRWESIIEDTLHVSAPGR